MNAVPVSNCCSSPELLPGLGCRRHLQPSPRGDHSILSQAEHTTSIYGPVKYAGFEPVVECTTPTLHAARK